MSEPSPMDVERLPFDQYQRYRLVADLLGEMRAGSEPLAVLDVGGRTALLRSFLPRDTITLVDVEASGESGLVLGDGSRLPFRDKSFDVVAAFDTLEHVPPAVRAAFVRECGRVARRWVVLAGPYESPRVVEAERLLQRFLRDKLEYHHRYLDEHRTNGLPVREETEALLRGLGADVVSIGHANLERWLALICVELYMDFHPALRELASSVYRFYNRTLYASDHAEPVYRHAVVAAFGGARLPDVSKVLGPPRAPSGALPPFTELLGELAAFGRDREAWRAEREGLGKMASDLESDLAGHRQALADTRVELANAKRAAVELQDELARERREGEVARAALAEDLEGHRAALASSSQLLSEQREQTDAIRAALEADLAGHKQVLADVRVDLEGHRAALRNVEQELAASIDHRTNLEQRADELAAELQHAQAEILARGSEIARLQAEVERQQAELRSRWRSLMRALSLRKPS